MNFPDRAARLRKIAGSNGKSAAFDLLVGDPVGEVDFANLRGAVTYYAYVSLRHAFPSKRFDLRADLFDEYADHIRSLPNVTPNGLILPKRENFLAYHEVHRAAADLLDRYHIASQVEVIHNPVNIRLVQGKVPPEVGQRARASNKLHSDIWAGEFANSLMIFLPLLGDIEHVGVEFYEPPEDFYPAWVRPLEDYNEGARLIDRSCRYDCCLSNGHLYFLDPFLLHRTVRKSNRWRLSLDFRFVPKEKLDSDLNVETQRTENYLPYEEWRALGTRRLLFTETPIDQQDARRGQNLYAAGYRTIRLNGEQDATKGATKVDGSPHERGPTIRRPAPWSGSSAGRNGGPTRAGWFRKVLCSSSPRWRWRSHGDSLLLMSARINSPARDRASRWRQSNRAPMPNQEFF